MSPRVRLRGILLILVTGIITALVILQRKISCQYQWQDFVPPLACYKAGRNSSTGLREVLPGLDPEYGSPMTDKFKAGRPKRAGEKYLMTLVMGRKRDDDTTWIDEQVPEHISQAMYIVDDPHAPLHPPRNKGNEAMVYLSYIIDHYANLSDVTLFMHHHRWSWHNNDLLDNDSAQIIEHVLPQHVIRQGYVNLRCQWDPGCPAWLNTSSVTVNQEKEEEQLLAQVWPVLFPHEPLPMVLAQVCCSQFALSRDRIRALPLSTYTRLRNWLLDTLVQDQLSGRVFEYVWQYLWTGRPVICPLQHACYCDLFGICFANEAAFQEWFEIRYHLRQDEWELFKLDKTGAVSVDLTTKDMVKEVSKIERAKLDKIATLRQRVNERWILLAERRQQAMRDGSDGKVRARVAERQMDIGDEK